MICSDSPGTVEQQASVKKALTSPPRLGAIQQIPDVFFANMLGMQRRQMFEVSETERALPDLNIKFKR